MLFFLRSFVGSQSLTTGISNDCLSDRITLFNCPTQQYKYEEKKGIIHDERDYEVQWVQNLHLDKQDTISKLSSELQNMIQSLRNQKYDLINSYESIVQGELRLQMDQINKAIDSTYVNFYCLKNHIYGYENFTPHQYQLEFQKLQQRYNQLQTASNAVQQEIKRAEKQADDINHTILSILETKENLETPNQW